MHRDARFGRLQVGQIIRHVRILASLCNGTVSARQNDEKMWRKIGNAQSRTTFFRHSAVLNLPAVLLRKLPNSSHDPDIPTERISKCAEAFICKFIDGCGYESLSTSPNS